MSGSVKIIVEVCALLAEQENFRETVFESIKGASIMGFSALVGGLLGGKEGMILGGTLGAALGMMATTDFKSIPQIIREDLTESQRNELTRRIKGLLTGVPITNVHLIMDTLDGNTTMKNNVLDTLKNFLRNDVDLSV